MINNLDSKLLIDIKLVSSKENCTNLNGELAKIHSLNFKGFFYDMKVLHYILKYLNIGHCRCSNYSKP